jgi:chemotaxis protein methyltransferase CheR
MRPRLHEAIDEHVIAIDSRCLAHDDGVGARRQRGPGGDSDALADFDMEIHHRPGELFADDAEKWKGWTIDILGTDVSSCVIDRARSGVYSQFEVQRGLAITQTIRWFEECGDGWRIAEPLRKHVRIQVHNLLEQPPQPGGFDIVLCRNVLLYLCSEKKALAFDRLSSALADDGWLMLGAGETVIGQTKKLSADPKARGLYRLEHRDKLDRRTIQERRAAARA